MQGRIGLLIDEICLNCNVTLIGWAVYDAEGLPLYSKFRAREEEFGAMAANIIDIYKRIPELVVSCYYFKEMNLFLHRIKLGMNYFILTIAIEKNIRNHGLVVMQLQKLENRILDIISIKVT